MKSLRLGLIAVLLVHLLQWEIDDWRFRRGATWQRECRLFVMMPPPSWASACVTGWHVRGQRTVNGQRMVPGYARHRES